MPAPLTNIGDVFVDCEDVFAIEPADGGGSCDVVSRSGAIVRIRLPAATVAQLRDEALEDLYGPQFIPGTLRVGYAPPVGRKSCHLPRFRIGMTTFSTRPRPAPAGPCAECLLRDDCANPARTDKEPRDA
ncbi:MAG: hypothetical protein WC789_10590 [Lentisphaeria bacterium]